MIKRIMKTECLTGIKKSPVTALLGPRQCGKTTLAKEILKGFDKSVYLDLERPSDLAKLENAEWYLTQQHGKLVCIDEIQRKPELFPLIRSIVDDNRRMGQFLILGSATKELIRQSSESLAGRITYKTLTPFLLDELGKKITIEDYLIKGGFPLSVMAENYKDSIHWREDFITAYIERDIHQWIGISSVKIRRIIAMLVHYNGQVINYSALGNSLGISNTSLKEYTELLAGTFLIDIVRPWTNNAGKRLVKAPKIYFSDTGIANAVLGIENFDDISGHPAFGSLWETMILANLRGNFPGAEIYYYRTSNGAELDFILVKKSKVIAIECKTNTHPVLTKGNYISISDIKPVKTFIVAPVKEQWSHSEKITVASLNDTITEIGSILG